MSAKKKPAKAPVKKPKRGSSAQGERGPHTPKVAGSKPAPATKNSRSLEAPADKKAPSPRKSPGSGAAKKPARGHKATKPAPVAQPAERAPRKGDVAGSKPARGSKPEGSATTPPTRTVEQLLAQTPAQDPDGSLNPRMLAFCQEYVRTFNGTASYLASHPGVTPGTAAVESCRLLKNPKVKAWIEQHRAKLSAAVDFSKADVIAELIALATADPNELTQMRVVACGQCWPSLKDGERPMWLEPDPECPVCLGEGLSRPWFADTRRLSPIARRLFSSVHVTREGMKINTRDQDGALKELAKVFGAYEADNKQKADAAVEALRAMFLNQLHAGAGRATVVREPARPQKGPLG